MGKDLAVETFLKNKDFYHPIGVKMIAIDLNVEKKKKNGMSDDISIIMGNNGLLVTGTVLIAATLAVTMFRRRR